MRDPRSLYELNADVQVPPGLPLVAGLTGFADAGSAVAQTTEYLLSTLDTTVVAPFDADELLDYRARRMRAPVVDAPAPPGVITPPPDPPEPRRDAVDTIMTPGPRV